MRLRDFPLAKSNSHTEQLLVTLVRLLPSKSRHLNSYSMLDCTRQQLMPNSMPQEFLGPLKPDAHLEAPSDNHEYAIKQNWLSQHQTFRFGKAGLWHRQQQHDVAVTVPLLVEAFRVKDRIRH